MKIVVYTAITKGYDSLKEVVGSWTAHVTFVAFLEEVQPSNGWIIRSLPSFSPDPCRNAKHPKILPHVHFPDTDYSIWVDGSIEIVSLLPPIGLISQALCNADIAVFKHRRRSCIYDEADACIQANKDNHDVIKTQVNAYRLAGYPPNNGLGECSVIIRRHTDAARKFNEAWYQEICTYSRRDQLSFDYTAWRTGIPYGLATGTIARNEHFRRGRHTKHCEERIYPV